MDEAGKGDAGEAGKPRVSRTAVLCLVLALVPHCWFFLVAPNLGLSPVELAQIHRYLFAPLITAAVAAIALGFVADKRIRASQSGASGRALVFVGVPLAFFACLGVFLYSGLQENRECAKRVECKSGMKQLCLTMLLYAADNDDRFPPDLQTLADKGYVKDMALFKCASVVRRSGVFDPRRIDATCDYVYAPAKGTDPPGSVPILWDRPGNHVLPGDSFWDKPGTGANVGSCDGDVMWASIEGLRETVETSLRYYVTPPELPLRDEANRR